MTDRPPYQIAIEDAETAATAGDLTAAGQHLREAVTLQEAALGPLHPDLANTLNNLGVVAEKTGQLAEAERSYRRAYAIAEASLPLDHAFVETSRANLRDFCASNGIPLVTSPPAAEPQAAPAMTVQEQPRPPVAAASAAPAGPSRGSRVIPLVPLVVIGVGVFCVLLAWLLLRATHVARQAPPATNAGTPPTDARVQPSPGSPDRPPPTTPPTQPVTAPRPAPAAVPQPFPTAAAKPPATHDTAAVVSDARLCRALDTTHGEWSCVPLADPAQPGRVYFLTRIASGGNLTVEHRWYRGDRLIRTKQMKVTASPAPGYRAYSQQVVDAREGGAWRVELLDAGERVLHTMSFVVR